MKSILVSACLLGKKCAYHGEANLCEAVCDLQQELDLISICPEELGGLTTPRDRARIVGGSGEDVWNGGARVVTCNGNDVTNQYLQGGRKVLELAQQQGITEAILKANSPSCGCGGIFSEDFSDLRPGDGTTTALLKRNGIKVITEVELEKEPFQFANGIKCNCSDSPGKKGGV